MSNCDSEFDAVADQLDAATLKRMVDLGAFPCVGKIKEKIENSAELQLVQAMDAAGLNELEKLKLAGVLTAMTQPTAQE